MSDMPGGGPAADSDRERAVITARLEDLLGGRSEREVALVTRLVTGFGGKASALLDQWFAAAAHGEQDEARRHVHTLKGAALNLGSITLSQVCEQVESRPGVIGAEVLVADRQRLAAAAADFSCALAGAAGGAALGTR
jgi:HPt (histidine-containing phosphotransfer) domain-containing protein